MSDETNPIDFSLILPTRERLPKFRRLCESVKATCFHPARIEMWSVIDWDDAEMLGNKPDLEATYPWLKLFVTPRQGNMSMGYYNPLALASRGRWVQVLNDDVVFKSPAWDIVGRKALEAGHALYPDGIFYGRTFDDLQTGYSCFPLLTRQAVEALGWFFHPEFTSWGADIHLKNLFDIVGRVVDVPYHFDHHREHDAINQRQGWISSQNHGSVHGEAWRLGNIITERAGKLVAG